MTQTDTSVLNEFDNLHISEIRIEDVLREYNMSADSLKNIAEQLKIEENRKKLESGDWLFYEKLTSAANNSLINRTSLNFNPFNSYLYADIFRCLRNSCAGIINNQKMILRSSIFRNAVNIFENFMALYFSEEFNNTIVTTTLQCSLQFIGNLVCQYKEAKIAVWEIFYSFRYFSMLLASENIKVKECTAMVFYNCLTTEHRNEIVNKNDTEIIMYISQLLILTESEWSMFALEYFLQEEEFIVSCYKSLPIKNRLLLLDIIAEKLDGNDVNLSELMINFISDNFKSKAMDIVKICSSSDRELNSLEIARTLLLLCKAAIIPKFEKLKIDRKLLETTIDTLKVVHLLGKSENNLFSPITSLKVEDSNYDAEESHSSYGFKRNLIRLIANFCSENLVNQNIAREMDAIPLILDCCNIDSRNPFILQWSVLCLRNLVHKNSENQLLLAQMTIAEGMAESTRTLLKEMGLRVEYREGELKLLTLHSENDLEL